PGVGDWSGAGVDRPAARVRAHRPESALEHRRNGSVWAGAAGERGDQLRAVGIYPEPEGAAELGPAARPTVRAAAGRAGAILKVSLRRGLRTDQAKSKIRLGRG